MQKILFNASIIDGIQDEVIKNGYIVIDEEKGTIVESGSGHPQQWIAQLGQENAIDLNGFWVVPGLINCHTHMMRDGSAHPDALIQGEGMEMIALSALRNAQRHLQLGITTIRDLGSPGITSLAVRKAVNTGLFKGPTIFASGQPIIMTGGHFRFGKEADGEDEVRKVTRQLLKAGVDVVKLFSTGGIYSNGEEPGSPQLTKEEICVAVEEAHKKGVPVASHAQGLQGILNSLEAGVDTIEHAIFADDRAIDLFLEKDAFLVPTMVAMTSIAEGGDKGIPSYAVEKAKAITGIHFRMLEKAVRNGVTIATGTDAGSPCNPPEDYFAELRVMKAAGMTEMDIIKSSTSIAAKAIGTDRVGSIRQGLNADLVVIDSNPLDDIDHLQKVKMIVKNGEILSQINVFEKIGL